MESGYYHSCDYDLLGTCEDCLTDHPGNWFVLLEDKTSCCVADAENVKAPRALSVNTTAGCPEVLFLKAASYSLGAFGVAACVGTMGYFARWIYRRWFAKKDNEEVNEVEMVAMGEPEEDGQAGVEEVPNELEIVAMGEAEEAGQAGADESPNGKEREIDVCKFCEGYSGDDEASSPGNSQDALNMLAYEVEDEFNLGGGLIDNVHETAV